MLARFSRRIAAPRLSFVFTRGNASAYKAKVSDYLDKAQQAPDALTTVTNDLVIEAQRIQTEGKKATWLQALTERQKQLASGKVLDLYSYTTPGTTEIGERKRSDSFTFLLLPFKDDAWLLDSYVNAFGRLKVGQLFQDLDALAGLIAYKQCAPAEPMLVTASVDRVCMLQRVDDIHKYNLMVSGSVVWVGRSSMEITIRASITEDSFPAESEINEKYVNEKTSPVLSANFTFVARNPETHRSFPINKLLPLNEREWTDFTRAESHNAAKKLRAKKQELAVSVPTSEETALMHNLWKAATKLDHFKKETGLNPKNLVFMKDTTLKLVMFMQPQYRNRHSYMIFGGYLMKQTFELAYCSSAAFSHAPPRFISLDATSFTNPVPVGSVLYLKSQVVYTEHITGLDAEEHENAKQTDTCMLELELQSYFDLYGKPALNKLSLDPKDFLNKEGTVVQVKVDTSVRSLDHDSHLNTGSFVFSFFVPKYSYENETLGVGKPSSNSAEELNNGYYAVVPESYSDMINFIEGKRRATETAESFKRLKDDYDI